MFAVNVPIGNFWETRFSQVERVYLVKVPGKANNSDAVALCRKDRGMRR